MHLLKLLLAFCPVITIAFSALASLSHLTVHGGCVGRATDIFLSGNEYFLMRKGYTESL